MNTQDKLANFIFTVYFMLVSGTVLFLTVVGVISFL
jgi:hypothetical protein